MGSGLPLMAISPQASPPIYQISYLFDLSMCIILSLFCVKNAKKCQALGSPIKRLDY
jgi:hypothetical protein